MSKSMYYLRTFRFLGDAICNRDIPAHIRDAMIFVSKHLRVVDSNRMTRSAGMACVRFQYVGGSKNVIPESLTIKFSPRLLCRTSKEDVDDTITHELAHIIEFVLRGTSDHGPLWKQIHNYFGGTGKRYHTIDRTGLHRKVTRYEYRRISDGKTVLMTKANHIRAMRYATRSFEFLAVLKVRGTEVVERIPAQYA